MSLPAPYYQDDAVTLYHGDCREILPSIDEPIFSGGGVMVTDPPYGIGWTRNGISRTSSGDRARGDFNGRQRPDGKIENDLDTSARDEVAEVWGDRPAIMFGSLFVAPPPGTRHVAVYVKPKDGGAMSAFGLLRRDCEGIYFLGSRRDGWGEQERTGRGAMTRGLVPTRMRSSVFQTGGSVIGTAKGISARYGHPHAKPLDVLDELLTVACPPEWVVVDPFAGSGSTLVAAKMLGRKAVGIEIEEKYCEVAARRLAQDVLDLGAAA